MSFIGQAWRGEERLWKVFWVYGALVGFGFGFIDVIIKHFGFFSPIGLGYIAFRVVYTIWMLVAQWRCAFNADWTFWSYVVRVLIVLDLVGIAIGVLVGGGLALNGEVWRDLIKAAECRKEVIEYQKKGGTDIDGFKKKCVQDSLHKNSEAPATPSASVSSVVVPADPADYYQNCLKSMTDFARDRGSDPQQYIAQNQAYLKQCVDYYKNQHIPDKKAP